MSEERREREFRGWMKVYRAFITKWAELTVKQLDEDVEKAASKAASEDNLEPVFIRAKYIKYMDLLSEVWEAIKRYETPDGKLDLATQVFGKQLDLPSHELVGDIETRLEWYKQRIAKAFEKSIKTSIDGHAILSPVEQIFLMEWNYQSIEGKYGVRLLPQHELATGDGTFKVDFVVTKSGSSERIAIELDGHEFHEKTREQAARDRSRERCIVREGFAIQRFTSSEVFRNPRACVKEVVALIEKRLS